MQLPPDFSEFLRLLSEAGVEYLLIGGYAVGYYGYPRYTGDMDVWVHRTGENTERLVRALVEFGFDSPELSPDLFLRDNHITRLGREPVRIEILTSISGVEFEACYEARQVIDTDAAEVSLISLDDLLKNKRASARHKDLEDVIHLERLKR